MDKGVLLPVACKEGKGFLQVVETCLGERCVSEQVMDCVHDSGKFCECLE
jgi:hypothetical protein